MYGKSDNCSLLLAISSTINNGYQNPQKAHAFSNFEFSI
jgi:hypothetical protein